MTSASLQINHAIKIIEICNGCAGAGKVTTSIYMRRSNEDDTPDICGRCNGTGRMVKKILIEYEKFTP